MGQGFSSRFGRVSMETATSENKPNGIGCRRPRPQSQRGSRRSRGSKDEEACPKSWQRRRHYPLIVLLRVPREGWDGGSDGAGLHPNRRGRRLLQLNQAKEFTEPALMPAICCRVHGRWRREGLAASLIGQPEAAALDPFVDAGELL
ncbi:unnamed protein product [Urochloa humidicola]